MARLWHVTLDSDFKTGAGIQLRSPRPGVVTFYAPWDTSPLPLWFHFRVRGARGWKVRFVLMNANRCLGGAARMYLKKKVRPVFCEDAPPLPPSRRRWRRFPPAAIRYDEKAGHYNFTTAIHSDEAYVAFCYPYGPAEWSEFVCAGLRSPFLRLDWAGMSALGRPVPQAILTEGRALGKPVVWLTARNHAAEVSGAWALEGTLRWLLSRDAEARRLRRRFVFRIFPMVDVDGVVEGWYGKERAPLDFNRAWLEDSPRPEVRRILADIFHPGRPAACLLDYHSPGAGDPHLVFLPAPGSTPAPLQAIAKTFAKALQRLAPAAVALSPKDITWAAYMGHEAETSCSGAIGMAKGIPALSLEISYALTRNGHVLTRAEYLRYGAAVGQALGKALAAPGQSAQEIGWLPYERAVPPIAAGAEQSFPGAFSWSTPRAASWRLSKDGRGEILSILMRQRESYAYLAAGRLPFKQRPLLDLTVRLAPRARRSPIRVLAHIFYYGDRGLRYRADEKIELTARGGDWRRHLLRLTPPCGAQTLRVSFEASGGPGRFEFRPVRVR